MVMDVKNPLALSFTNKAIENVKSRLISSGMNKNVVNNICRNLSLTSVNGVMSHMILKVSKIKLYSLKNLYLYQISG